MNRKGKDIILKILAYSYLFVAVCIVVVPVLWMVSAAFTPGNLLKNVPILPDFRNMSLEHFRYLFEFKSTTTQVLSDYWQAFFVTLRIALYNTVLTVSMSCLVGFAFSRYKFKGKKKALLTMMGLQMFPSFMAMLALFLLFREFRLLNNPFAMALVYSSGAIPYNTFIVRGFMRGIPKSLDEAASIDGATNLQIMYKIIIPLAVPIIGFIAVNAFMGPWLDYLLPSKLMPQLQTVAMWLYPKTDVLNAKFSPLNFTAGALVLAVPIMVVQAYMQKYVISGLTAGADKG